MIRLLLAMTLLLAGADAVAAGSGGGGQMPRTEPQTPEQAAASYYNSGLRYKSRAWKQEQRAAKARTPEQRDKLLAKAANHYQKAVEKQMEAVRANPQHHEAANELGYGLRRLGRYQQAIEWYDRALALRPDFLEAVEYRGEAYLAIGNIDAAKAAYMELFRGDRALADQLLTAMEVWLGEQRGKSSNSAEHGAFSAWVGERKALADLTRDVSRNRSRSW